MRDSVFFSCNCDKGTSENDTGHELHDLNLKMKMQNRLFVLNLNHVMTLNKDETHR